MATPILSSTTTQTSNENFGAELVGNGLAVSKEVANVLAGMGIDTAERFVTYLFTFPSAFAALLHWQVDGVLRARESLIRLLEGRVAKELLHPPAVPERHYGAVYPGEELIPGVPEDHTRFNGKG